jgi:hypothetical protein
MENKSAPTENIKDEAENSSSTPNSVLLGTFSYTNQEDYEKFLSNLDVNNAIFVLMASANYGQAKGLFNLDESELIAKAIKTIKKSAKQVDETSTTEPATNN